MQNFNSLGCLVLEISAFQYEACHGFRAGASVHKLFVGGVYRTKKVTTSLDCCLGYKASICYTLEIYIYMCFSSTHWHDQHDKSTIHISPIYYVALVFSSMEAMLRSCQACHHWITGTAHCITFLLTQLEGINHIDIEWNIFIRLVCPYDGVWCLGNIWIIRIQCVQKYSSKDTLKCSPCHCKS